MSGQTPCPASPQLLAPEAWTSIDFISDLHLDQAHPLTQQAFVDYLAHTPASAVMILGDLFEVWVGDDGRQLPFEAACTAAMAQAGQRLWLGLMVGNRDFLIGPEMLAACHAHALPDPLLLEAFGQRHVVTHGDAWCLSDTEYLAFRGMVRQDAWQQAFLAKPLAERLVTARGIRQQSEARKMAHEPQMWADVDAAHASEFLRQGDSLSLIHGHTHRPGSEPFGPAGATRDVLSDWDLDQAAPRAEVLRLSPAGLERLSLAQACSPRP